MRFLLVTFRPQIGMLQFSHSVLFFGARANQHHGKITSVDVCYVAVVVAGETCRTRSPCALHIKRVKFSPLTSGSVRFLLGMFSMQIGKLRFPYRIFSRRRQPNTMARLFILMFVMVLLLLQAKHVEREAYMPSTLNLQSFHPQPRGVCGFHWVCFARKLEYSYFPGACCFQARGQTNRTARLLALVFVVLLLAAAGETC